jgi:enoyl-CoA hydratase
VLECVEVGSNLSVEEGLLLEATHFGLLSASADMREGTAAFLARRKAAFTGR